MRIRTFNKLVENETKPYSLKDCNVVIDGQNFFYSLYEKSRLPFAFGCESDRFANFLREHLGMFKKANVRCYIIFKGGSSDMEIKFEKTPDRFIAKKYNPGDNIYVKPILAKDVCQQVLDEMGFDYVVCYLEAKKECVALAQALNCPVISYDIEFSFSKVPYILTESLRFYKAKNTIECSIFDFKNFLRKYGLTEEKLAIFMVLTDECHDFPENYFLSLIKSLKIRLSNYTRNLGLLAWLSKTTRQKALDIIFKFTKPEDRKKFEDKEKEMKAFIGRQETGGLPVQYLLNGKSVQVTENDPLWFEKGVVCGHIAIPYIDLYRSSILVGSRAIEDTEADDSLLLSSDIVKYACNLLTNYKKEEYELYRDHAEIIKVQTGHDEATKPNYEAEVAVFESGWDSIRGLGLFEHFLKESLRGFNFQVLEQIPEDVRLLMIALAYFSSKKTNETLNEVYSVLLSYVMLGVVFEKNYDTMCESDCSLASNLLEKYFELNNRELKEIFDEKIIHPLAEFQYCLLQINYLNNLCGYFYRSTIYHKTYNATFVYKILYTLKNNKGGDGMNFLMEILEPASTVLKFFEKLTDCYRQIIPQI